LELFETSKRNKRQVLVYVINAKWWLHWSDFVGFNDETL